MDPDKGMIEWNHFEILHNEDSKFPANIRLCPKITKTHLKLNKATKMRVSFAVQVREPFYQYIFISSMFY